MKLLLLTISWFKEGKLKQFLTAPSTIACLLLTISACSVKPAEEEARSTKTKILVLGTLHFIPDSSMAEAQQIAEALIAYNPDLVATEFTPYYDTLSLRKYYTDTYNDILRHREKEGISVAAALDSITHYQQLAQQSPSPEALAKLAKYYYLLGDLSNSYYYVYKLNAHEGSMTANQLEKVKSTIGEDRYARLSRSLKNDEYGTIVFPVAHAAGLATTTPVDHQARADSFVYWQKKHYDILIAKYSKPVYDSIIEAFEATNDPESAFNTITSQNTHHYIKSRPDFYWPIPGLEYDSTMVAKTLEPWSYRNELAIKRLHEAIQETGSKRALISFGAMHSAPFIEILKKYPQYEVILLEDLYSNQPVTKK
jgi:hypothetical protein